MTEKLSATAIGKIQYTEGYAFKRTRQIDAGGLFD
jgi:hypothetical protein